jgi:simple sugar transport system ATP-binding protein
MRRITKRFSGVAANEDVSLGIYKGEVFALLGENGAGKSTLMNILFGMYEPDEGEIWVRGGKVSIKSPNEAVRLDIAMVHQHFKLVENYTVTENIVLGMEPVKRLCGVLPMVDLKSANEKVRELSRRYGLEVDPTAKIEDLKVYARQRVEILKMLYREADILIFDEPTAVLTPQEISALLNIIKKLRDDGKTIILISHKLEEIKQVANRCAILKRGKLLDVLDVSTTSTATMAKLMVGHELSLDIEKPPACFGTTVLQVKNLTVENKQRFTVVNNVSFSIREGEIFAIAGVSGNGQLEVADAITGMCAVKSGNIILDDSDITHKSVRERNQAGISYIPEDRQQTGLILDFSLADNLALKRYHTPPFCNGMVLRKSAFSRYANELIGKYDIRGGGANGKARAMSGGNQQKAIVAREIELQSRLTIFVQPTQGLDIGAIMDIREKMIQQRNNGKAILLISLELDEVLACADTIGVMYNGAMINIAPADSISANEVGEYMMGVKKYEESYA